MQSLPFRSWNVVVQFRILMVVEELEIWKTYTKCQKIILNFKYVEYSFTDRLVLGHTLRLFNIMRAV